MNKNQAVTKHSLIKENINQARNDNSAKSILKAVEDLESIGEKSLIRFKLFKLGNYKPFVQGLIVEALTILGDSQQYSEYLESFEQNYQHLVDREVFLTYLHRYIFYVNKTLLQEWMDDKSLSTKKLRARLSAILRGVSPHEKSRLIELRKFEDLRDNGFKSHITVQLASQVICRPLEFEYEGHCYSFEFSYHDNQNAPIKSEGVVLDGDIHGLTKQTLITITTNKRFAHPDEVIHLLNYFVKAYRIAMDEEWLLKVSSKLIIETNIRYTLSGEEVHRLIFPPQGLFQTIREEDFDTEKLCFELENPSQSVWKHSYLDAKLNFGINNLTQAVMDLNIAFENFVGIKVDERLSKHLEKDDIEQFYSGRSYENLDSKTKGFVTEEAFEAHFLSDPNYKLPPSTYRLVGYCNKLEKFSCSRKEINSLINNIRKYRNDIAHGRYINDSCLLDHIPQAFESFEEFQKLWD
ncbi:hypothetical protein KI655_09915 [Vibrio sp. D404a]|uniref:hypothetical protein n=1 Tax=unclassified Vibrio TaxID=2614977 RepID=UPI0025526839|nr:MULTISPECIES: hypothetical protein [unclassified Vibrio]MDK9737616.1 hypothetical protein [Vibrio sp. D404a]MDK9797559.1 hypothetical protein [Vibrio sp. D449a]